MTAAGRTAPNARGPVPFARGNWPVLVAWALVVLVLAMAGGTFPLGTMAGQSSVQIAVSGWIALVFAAVGLLIVIRQRGNKVGWLFLAGGVFDEMQAAASLYTDVSYRLGHDLPLAPLALVLQPSWAPAIVCFGLAVMLFPDGKLPFPKLRWLLRVYLAVGAVWAVGAVTVTIAVIAEGRVRVDAQGNLLNLDSPRGDIAWWGVVQVLFFTLLSVTSVASLVGQTVRFRRSTGERRQQLKWLLSGTAGGVLGVGGSVGLSGATGFLGVVGGVVFVLVTLLPISVGVAVLRYRLYDIDRLISRTLAYATVTALLVGTYAGLVLLATRVLPFSAHSDAAVAASTLVAAALFNPLRRRVQHLVDRRFNRARYDADRIVADFAARLQDATHPDAARLDLTATVQRALEPAHLSLWISESVPPPPLP